MDPKPKSAKMVVSGTDHTEAFSPVLAGCGKATATLICRFDWQETSVVKRSWAVPFTSRAQHEEPVRENNVKRCCKPGTSWDHQRMKQGEPENPRANR
eukprot:symbB.v1.2.037911.t1/scaffold5736.1/size24094/2